MKITGFNIPSDVKIPNLLFVNGGSLSLSFVFFDTARVTDKLGGRSINIIANAEMQDGLNNPNYQNFPALSLTFTSPPISDETNFEFGWTPTTVKLVCDIGFTQAGYVVPPQREEIELDYNNVIV